MSWSIAFVICFTVLIVSLLVFFLTVYFRELKREEKIIESKKNMQNLLMDPALANQVLYLLPTQQPKKTKKQPTDLTQTTQTKTNKKNIN